MLLEYMISYLKAIYICISCMQFIYNLIFIQIKNDTFAYEKFCMRINT